MGNFNRQTETRKNQMEGSTRNFKKHANVDFRIYFMGSSVDFTAKKRNSALE